MESFVAERWTITKPFEGRYRPMINHGGRPYWCMFDYAVRPDQDCSCIELSLAADADTESVKWFPFLKHGILRAVEAAMNRGREWVGIHIEIRKVHTHSIDTTASGCERYGFSFVMSELEHRATRVSEQDRG